MSKLFIKVIKLSTIVCLTIAILLVSSKNSSSTNPQVWVTGSMERIRPNEQPGNLTSIELYAARGEYESFQIAINSDQDNQTQINLTVSDLYGSDGRMISKTNITLYQEHYTYVNQPSPTKFGSTNSSLGKGWYPDGLIPLVNSNTTQKITDKYLENIDLNLKSDTNQTIWVDIFIPRDAPADLYQGKFTVATNRGQVEGEILLKVWDFELPLQPSLNSAFLLWENQNKEDLIELLKHKIMPVETSERIDQTDQKELIEQWGLRSARLPFWSGADYYNCSMKPAPLPQAIKSAAAQHEPDLFLYVYAVDEIDNCTNLYEPLKQWGKNIEQAGVKHLAVMAPVPKLYDYVDIWVVDPKRYNINPKHISEVLARGQEVWFYTALVQDNYSPKWQIDFPPINYRIPHGFINQSLGLTGLLYWAVDYWEEDPWQSLNYLHEGENFPGEGTLVYPGEGIGIDGIVPSMRLKWIRDGVEDYEYIEILKNLGEEDWALEMSRSVGADWKHWTRKPQKLETARIKLGEKIEQIYHQKNLKSEVKKGK